MTSICYTVGQDPAESLSTWLDLNKPSTKTSAETDWIWIRHPAKDNAKDDSTTKAEEAALEALQLHTAMIASIESDPAIPVRGKKDLLSKKQRRDAESEACTAELASIAHSMHATCGKWMFFWDSNFADIGWSILVHSFVDGPLSRTAVHTMKIAPSDALASEQSHLVCLYLPDIFNADDAKAVLDVLITQHGMVPSSAKPDLYTVIGLDSKHPSKLKPSIHTPGKWYSKEKIQSMKDEYFTMRDKEQGRNTEKRTKKVILYDEDEDEDDFLPPKKSAMTAKASSPSKQPITSPPVKVLKPDTSPKDASNDDTTDEEL